MLLVAVLGLLIALPLAALVGTNTYRGQLAVSAQQQASRHLTTATLVENAPTPVPATDGAYLSANGGTTGTHARWTLPDGAERVGTVAADPGSPAGTRVPVWLSDAGNPVPAPMTSSDATTTGILAGIFAWLVVALGLTAVYWSVRLVLDRRRAVHWEREWQYAGERWARF
ncbi:hypothetical protein SAMN05421835_13714 [Amycolatopsis sacchari]|uniref:Transmembrane protein n=1 Tax=Amycolatopsis sacchari TaxID=115433 RepID=A0A1I4CRA7_9PSEU|nr:hypothetical protein [Amycolatopsis sacchari]SFK83802.1 hypothetical protein SAMN05421835_13714 [Amycolatopsis sacchari]